MIERIPKTEDVSGLLHDAKEGMGSASMAVERLTALLNRSLERASSNKKQEEACVSR
jgi:hypothetical protein